LEQLPLDSLVTRPSPRRADWKCVSCGASENLWFNLSDGYIGCGRKHWDGTGGCGAAAEHYAATGRKYHLAVKLGTITPQGADVWSYAEDDMVKDKNLGAHLAHFGIDVMAQEKYDKSVEELEVARNKNFVFGMIVESGRSLTHVAGAGLVGFDNLGNSCYVNSILQTLLAMPEVTERYQEPKDEGEFAQQMAKLVAGTCTERYVKQKALSVEQDAAKAREVYGDDYVPRTQKKEEESKESEGTECVSVAPRTLKRLVGRGHADFATNRQQDAVEYLRHILDFSGNEATKALFAMKVEERLQCQQSMKVRYSHAEQMVLRIDVDVALAVNAEEVAQAQAQQKSEAVDGDGDSEMKDGSGKEEKESKEAKVLPRVPFDRLVGAWLGEQMVSDWMSPETGVKGTVSKRVRLATFPQYLAVQLQRYYVDEAWLPQKREVEIPMPQQLDLTHLRATGIAADEQEMKKDGDKQAQAQMEPDEQIVSTLVMLGLAATQNAAKRAALAVQNANADMAAAWIMEHASDANINDPIESPDAGGDEDSVDAAALAQLTMITGQSAEVCTAALQENGGNAEAATNWLFSQADLASAVAEVQRKRAEARKEKVYSDGEGKYELVSIVSHLGTATSHGHYVAHIKKDGEWIFFNDGKVAKSQEPPFEHGYLYIFKRKQ